MRTRRQTVLHSVDERVGGALERAVIARHRRRLRRLGAAASLDPPPGSWAAASPPPRAGCSLDVIVDGAEALPRMAAAIDEARSHVHVAAWHLSPDFAVVRDGRPRTIRDVLAEAAERVEVRVLMWAGAPLPWFTPDRRRARAARDALVGGTRIDCALDARERPLHCHHEKLVIVDDERAFVGGIDFTALNGDRFDAPSHPFRDGVGWHDAASELAGPAIADVASHFAMRWREVTGRACPEPSDPEPGGSRTVQVARTIPDGIYEAVPAGSFAILEAYLAAIRSAERLIYLESQYLWSPEIVAALVDKLASPPSERFRLLIVLPARPYGGGEDTLGQLCVLAAADEAGGGGRLLACAPWASRGRLRHPIYVHAKIGIVDDRWVTIGSANLNEHSLFNDTEMNLVCDDADLARDLRQQLWAEHLDITPQAARQDPVRLLDEVWTPTASEGRGRLDAGDRLRERMVRLVPEPRRTRRLLWPIEGLTWDG